MTTPTTPGRLRLEYILPEELRANPDNWRTHPPSQMEALAASIDEVGWAGALLFNERTKHLLNGHARLELAAKNKSTEPIPVLIGSWDAQAEKKILAVLDPIGGMAETDKGALENLLREIGTDDSSLASLLNDIAEQAKTAFQSVTVPIVDLKFHPRNYKQHPADQIEHLVKSISEHGFYRNVVLARDNTILAGQGVVQAAVRMGKNRIPAIKLDVDPNEPRALKVLTSDNEIAKLGEVDDRALTELLKEIMDTDDLLGTGYDRQQLAGLIYTTRPESEIKDVNEAAEWVGMPEYTPAETPIRLVVSFENEADRDRFMTLIGAVVIQKKSSGAGSSKTWSIWWPERKKQDLKALRFEDAQPSLLDAAATK